MNMKKKSRSQKAFLNFLVGMVYEAVAIAAGLIVPRLILTSYGSAYNGITHSISQFISYIALMKAGIGGVTRSALYKPLAKGDNEEISEVIASTQRFMRKIAYLFVIFIVGLSIVYPLVVREFDFLFTASLVLIISISTFAEYYFGFSYQMLLMADQKQYIYSLVSIVVIVLNSIASIFLMNNGYSIHIVKLASTLIYMITPLFLYLYVSRKYKINHHAKPSTTHIAQRWDAFAQELSNFINNNTDIVVLTLFASMAEVSVYTVYHYVSANIKKIVKLFTSSFGAAFGDMYAKGEYELFNRNLNIYELIIHSFVSIIYSTTLVMIVPFALIYTKGVTDISYARPLFSIVLVTASAFECFRVPYKTIVTSVGHFKQTRNGAIVESIINIIISVAAVIRFGLIGVAIGTLIAMAFRSSELAYYIYKNITGKNYGNYLLRVGLTLGTMAAVYLISLLYLPGELSIAAWLIYATITAIIAIIITVAVDLVFYHKETLTLIKKLKKMALG